MGRKRRRLNSNLPKYVYRGKSAYVYRPYINGVRLKEKPLCPLTSTTREIYEAYEELTHIKPKETLSWLINLYLDSDKFESLSPLTQKSYKLYARVIAEESIEGGVFGDVLLIDIDHTVIRAYLDSKIKTPVEGNRRVAFLGSVYKWGFQRGHAPNNPCLGITKYSEKPRSLYVTDEMYNTFYEYADKPWYIRPMMEFAYLCRMRRVEILDLTKDDILEEGLKTRRRKGSNDAITLWTPRLREAVKECLKRDPVHYLISNKGNRVKDGTFTTAWGIVWRKKKPPVTRFSFHDLKSKGVSDFDGDEQLAGGHKTNAMVAVYDRDIKKVEATK